jgi:isopentenyl-diphosphate delta-isomerase
VPVIAKEVGWGISEQAARQLAGAGVAADVAGGGEPRGAKSKAALPARPKAHRWRFRDWGHPHAESILILNAARHTCPSLPAADCERCGYRQSIALGASAAGIARHSQPPLKATRLGRAI